MLSTIGGIRAYFPLLLINLTDALFLLGNPFTSPIKAKPSGEGLNTADLPVDALIRAH